MTAMHVLEKMLFFVWISLFIAWFFVIAEMMAMASFAPWLFRYGLCVLRQKVTLRQPIWQASGAAVIEMRTGRAWILSPTECLFYRQRSMWTEMRTPFPLRGSIRWQGDQAQVEFRLPIVTPVFFGLLFLGCAVFGVMGVSAGQSLIAIVLLLMGWGFVGVLCWFSLTVELERIPAILSEFEAVFGRAAAEPAPTRELH